MAEKTPIAPQSITSSLPPAPPTPAAQPSASDKKKGKDKSDEPRDTLREIFETVVFVVVLVLLLKTFVAEAFVIPTGSMGPTLYGYQKIVTCDKCGHVFQINCSSEVDPQHGGPPVFVSGCYCPNCQNMMTWGEGGGPDWNSGDRVLVAKFLYDRGRLWTPKRHEVIVFKFPKNPQQSNTAMNYIKRCEGESEETIAIFGGDLYATRSLKYSHREASEKPEERWQKPNMYINDSTALTLFERSMARAIAGQTGADDFVIIRKPPPEMLTMRRIVFDNDNQPRDLAGKVRRWQWRDDGRWTGNDPKMPKTFTHVSRGVEAFDWLAYNHLLRDEVLRLDLPKSPDNAPNDNRRLITNTLGYNAYITRPSDSNQEPVGRYWVPDLMLDFEVKITSAQGELALELGKSHDRFRASFDLATGKCKLTRQNLNHDLTVLAEKDTPVKKPGTYKIRFANFDERLTLWVDGSLPFDDGVTYPPANKIEPTTDNDLYPAQIGVREANVEISHLQLWRDTYYTLNYSDPGSIGNVAVADQPAAQIQTFYVQPGHYLALGDNSASSSDSRYWGLVPERLLLGRALVVYFPFWPFTSETRAGLIR